MIEPKITLVIQVIIYFNHFKMSVLSKLRYKNDTPETIVSGAFEFLGLSNRKSGKAYTNRFFSKMAMVKRAIYYTA
jgi:hypothetical protein